MADLIITKLPSFPNGWMSLFQDETYYFGDETGSMSCVAGQFWLYDWKYLSFGSPGKPNFGYKM
jgi:hypothetical protein